MLERRVLLTSLAAGALAAPFVRTRPAAAQEVWQIQSLWQAGSINQKVFERFAHNVEAASAGRIMIEPLPVKAIVAHNETLEAVGSGVLAGQHAAAAYFAGRDPAFGLLGDLNAGYEDPYQMTLWFYHGGGLELARELYAAYGLFFVGPVFWGMESIPMKKRVASIEEFAGVKVRMPEGPSADIFRKIGAAPANIPGAEVYTSLERGVIDGADWGTLSMNQDLGYHKIAPYPIYPGIHSMPVGDVAINQARWDALEDDLKVLLEIAVRDFNFDMIQTIQAADLAAQEAAVAEGAELVDWSPEERKKLRAVAAEVWSEYAARNELSGRIYESHMAMLKSLGLL